MLNANQRITVLTLYKTVMLAGRLKRSHKPTPGIEKSLLLLFICQNLFSLHLY